MNKIPTICFITNSAGDWGGASRVLYTNLRLLDRSRLTPLVLLPKQGPIEEELQRLGIRYYIWGSLVEPGNPLKYMKGIIRALIFLRREHIAAIHLNGTFFWRPAELFAARLLRIPFAAHYHVIIRKPGPSIKHCRAAICVSKYTADNSLPSSLKKPVIYNPIDLRRFDAGHGLRNELGIHKDDIVIAFLGQIREIKGVADFIEMAKEIKGHNIHFLIAGECRDPTKFPGSYSESNLERMAGGDARIRYIGYIKEVENVYHTADIVVVPSRWEEPLGLINLEAGACRKVVVATRVGGIPEVIEDGVTGFLVSPGNIDELASRVRQLVADSALRQRMGEAGRTRVEEFFTLQPVRSFESYLLECSGHQP